MAAVALLASAVLTAEGIRNRLQDPRAEAARFITTQVPSGATLAFATTTEANGWAWHRWRHPAVDEDAYRIVPQLADPEYLVTTSFVTDQMHAALDSPQLADDLVWPDGLAGQWYLSVTPTPADFALYRALRDEGGPYLEIATWSAPTFAPLEFAEPEIRLYRRISPGSQHPIEPARAVVQGESPARGEAASHGPRGRAGVGHGLEGSPAMG